MVFSEVLLVQFKPLEVYSEVSLNEFNQANSQVRKHRMTLPHLLFPVQQTWEMFEIGSHEPMLTG